VPTCQVVIGRGRFDIPPGRRRSVMVRRVAGAGARASRADAVDVAATPYLHPRSSPPVGLRTRRVRLHAPPGLSRPAVPTAVIEVAPSVKARALVAFANVPTASTEARVELPGATVPLHRDMFRGYLTSGSSFAVGGARWHGQVPADAATPRTGQRIASRLVTCAAAACAPVDRPIVVSQDVDLVPICRLQWTWGPKS
jgi:hypothetical protein